MEVDILRVDILGVDVLGVDILRLTHVSFHLSFFHDLFHFSLGSCRAGMKTLISAPGTDMHYNYVYMHSMFHLYTFNIGRGCLT